MIRFDLANGHRRQTGRRQIDGNGSLLFRPRGSTSRKHKSGHSSNRLDYLRLHSGNKNQLKIVNEIKDRSGTETFNTQTVINNQAQNRNSGAGIPRKQLHNDENSRYRFLGEGEGRRTRQRANNAGRRFTITKQTQVTCLSIASITLFYEPALHSQLRRLYPPPVRLLIARTAHNCQIPSHMCLRSAINPNKPTSVPVGRNEKSPAPDIM